MSVRQLVVGLALGVLAGACAHQTTAQRCREQCEREHPGQGWRGPYAPPTGAWQSCVDACRMNAG